MKLLPVLALVFVWSKPDPLIAENTLPDFERDIAPILEANCLSCHNREDAEGDLVLETRSLALEHPDSIIPGNSAESYLIENISGPDPEMPEDGNPLTIEQVEILRAWIDAGAGWPTERELVDNRPRDLDWWSLQPIVRPQVPEKDETHPVDAFINTKLTEKNLTPAGEADPVTLIRRLTYDLTGLPPVPEQVKTFVNEYASASSSSARNASWETWVDRLMASPEFGEKWAQHWLDIARFAETHGYDKDKLRNNAWPYRDYVIRSFNDDKSYGRFVQEQVAGDVLFPGEPDGVIGLGFLAAGPWDFIGHSEVGEAKLDGRIAKHLDRDEMVSAVFNVFQSTTVQCAQCHHHKFDPIKMEDYYRLHAVFAGVDRADRVYDGLSSEQMEAQRSVISKINTLKAEEEQLVSEVQRSLAAKVSGIERRIAEIKETYGTGLKPQYGYHSKITDNSTDEKWVQLDLGKPIQINQIRLIPAYDNYNDIGAGFGFPVRYRLDASNDPEFKQNIRVLRDATSEDQTNPRLETISIDVGGKSIRYIRMTATKLAKRKNDCIFALGELEAVNPRGDINFALNAKVTALDSIEQGLRWGAANLVDGIYFRKLSDKAPFDELRELEDRRDQITAEFQTPKIEARKQQIQEELAALNKQLKPPGSKAIVYAANTHFLRQGRFASMEGKSRPIHLLRRGDLRSPGEVMTPGALPFWPGAPEVFFSTNNWKEGEARSTLAHYLTSKENPLIWRSIANRLWQWTFGKPLAGAPNDFGRMGMEPTHPELLNFLAAQLRDDPNQSIKSVVRMLITSKTYRRSSQHDATNAEIDAGNQYWWRANRRRLSAEEFRDSLLAVSGALHLEARGGPSFYDFVIEKPKHSPHYEYHLHNPDDPASHRRTIYRFVVRSQPQPLLTTLDCADPSISVAVRDESTSALQALTQWNHQLVEAMARRFSERLLEEVLVSPEDTVKLACQLALARSPSPMERELLGAHFQQYGAASLARVIFNLNDFTYLD